MRADKIPSRIDFPPVSILKPLKGTDSSLKENLKSFFDLDYPRFEILISVADETDPALPIVYELLEENPLSPVRLFIGETDVGINPKVNNMMKSYESVQHDWIWISDSNVRVERNELTQMLSQIDENTGVLTGLVSGRNPQSLGGYLEASYLNTFYAKWMTLAAQFKKPCVIGKSMLFKKSMAQRFGGIAILSRYLAEDFMAGEATRKLGLKVQSNRRPIQQILDEHYTVKDFWYRHIRWGRMRKSQAPFAFYGEALTSSLTCGTVLAYASDMSITLLLFHFATWWVGDFWVQMKMGSRLTLMSFLTWTLREIFALPLWAHIAIGNTVVWRGQRLRLLDGGLLDDSKVA